ncbi:YcaO-like family protein [Kitasatospora sp. GP82]|uniref:YcaO-like family protein n=1 Tax=Kitasatospora sp. GP82 TaxID=3035089 RepID=UPI002473B97C|nr:YcaO-like family protein [Kitasatospora sp. GP82]MDH6125874.1 thiazole/oxazole-forming peptide maturase SagD family component [Kitasatospora sp. GP82]
MIRNDVRPFSTVITRMRTFAGPGGTPQRLRLAVADLPDLTGRLPWQGDRQAFGASWEGEEQAVRGATGEAVERYCAPWPRPEHETLHGSYLDLVRRGVPALDPSALALYSRAQYAAPGFRFRPFTEADEVWWVRGRSLSHGRDIHVPAFLVHASWPQMPQGRSEPRYTFPVLGGLAAGTTDAQAQLSALEEVVERDTTAIWWGNAQALPALPVPRDIAALLTPSARDFETRLIHLDNVFGVPVMAAVVRDSAEGWLTIGTAARHDAGEAARKALAEAYLLQLTCLSLDNPRTLAGLSGGNGSRPTALKPWRQDRGYLDSYRDDAADVVELICQQQLFLDRRAGERVAGWTWDLPERGWEGLPELPERSIDTLRARVEAVGHEVIWVDLSTPEADAAGMRAGRIIVPGTVCTAPAAFPSWGAGRVQRCAVQLGWRSEPLDESELNTFPMPHS